MGPIVLCGITSWSRAVEPWHLWVVLALGLVVAEMFNGDFWLFCLGLGALGAAAVSLVIPGLVPGILAFSAGSLLGLLAVRPALLRRFQRGPRLRTNVDALVGRSGVVTEAIEPGTGRGRVLVEGEDWRGTALDERALPAGTRVSVVQVDGTMLVVEQEPEP
jgi:membrane protein implicated in regulation of membrane protease activity